jgi:hypothetical protein
MTSTQHFNKLQTQLAHMIALEADIGLTLEKLIPKVSDHAEATALLTGFQNLSRDHWKALETRLRIITGNSSQNEGLHVPDFTAGLSAGGNYSVSESLQIVYTLLNQAVIGYSVLHPLATRFLDNSYVAKEGTSYHLTRQHTQNYVQAIQQISRLLQDVVIWELDQEGLECHCLCPSCSIGICLCALAGKSFLSDTWVEASPIAVDEGVYVQSPKKNSAATQAGLRRGDVILAIDGQKIESFWELFSHVENAKPGEEIRLTVRRDSEKLEEVAIVRPNT